VDRVMGYISSLSVLIPIILIIRNYSINNKLIPLNLISYVIIGGLFEIVTILQNLLFLKSTIGLSNIFALIETGFVLFSYKMWSNNAKYKKSYITLLLVYVFIWFYVICDFGIETLNSSINGTEALIVIIGSILFLYDCYVNDILNVRNKWQTIICSAFLYYFIVNAGIYSFTEFFLDNNQKENWVYFSVIHLIGNTGMNILLGIGLYQCNKQL
jgi:hypothetical protein